MQSWFSSLAAALCQWRISIAFQKELVTKSQEKSQLMQGELR